MLRIGGGTEPRGNPLNLIRLAPAEGWFLVDRPAFTVIASLLQPGERIVWQGKPDPWVASQRLIPIVLFMSLWTGGILFAAWNIIYSNKPNASGNFGLVFIIAMLLFGGASWFRALKSFFDCWNTLYVLTDRRLMITTGRDTRSFTGAALGDLSRTGGQERGSIRFGGSNSAYGRRTWGLDTFDGLYGIQNPAGVEALIYQTLIMPKGGSR
jgi:hypothetical protein